MSSYNICAVHFNKEQNKLDKIFNKFKDNRSNLLYTNCRGKIKIGNDYFLNKQFDACLYSPENDIIILIERGSKETHYDFKEYLTKKDIYFDEVRFINLKENYEEPENIPSITFAREKQILEYLVRDSKAKGYDTCTFYPQINSNLLINYPDNESLTLDEISLKGLIIFTDKYIFMNNDFNPKNISMNTAAGVLINENINVNIRQEKFPQELLIEEKGSKVLCKKI